jgi:hypothetical protein
MRRLIPYFEQSVDLFRVKMVDFQGVCLQRALRLEKSAGGLFRGVCINQTLSNSILLLFRFSKLFPS